MTSSRSKTYEFPVPDIGMLRTKAYKNKCTELMLKWYYLLDYEDLDAWFDSNRCCLPISLSRALRNGKAYINIQTTL